jgi:hypothetical protein
MTTTAPLIEFTPEPINLGWFRGRNVILPQEPALTELHGNCPNCEGAVQISVYRDGCERHECRNCRYLMVWTDDFEYSKVVSADGPARVAQDGRTIFTTLTPKWFPFVFTPSTLRQFRDRYKYAEGIVGHAIYGVLADKTVRKTQN